MAKREIRVDDADNAQDLSEESVADDDGPESDNGEPDEADEEDEEDARCLNLLRRRHGGVTRGR